MSEAMEKEFERAIAAKDLQGVIMAACDTKNNRHYSKVLGDRTLLDGSKKPLELDDTVFLASCTKLLTTLACVRLFEDGKLALDDPASKYAPEIAKLEVIRKDGSPGETEPQARPITIRHLLTHSSGLAYEVMSPELQAWRKHIDPEGKNPPNSLPNVTARYSTPLMFQPGTSWSYGTSLDWAGLICERVSGLNLEELINKEVLGKLLDGKPSWLSFFPMKEERFRANMVDLSPSDKEGKGLAAASGWDVHGDAQAYFGGQGSFGSVAGYIQVLESLARNDGKVLKPETIEGKTEGMDGKGVFSGHLEKEAKKNMMDLLATPMGAAYFGQRTSIHAQRSWGLGGLLMEEDDTENDQFKARTMTWGGGINSVWFVDPELGLAAVAVPVIAVGDDYQKAQDAKMNFRKGIYEWRKNA